MYVYINIYFQIEAVLDDDDGINLDDLDDLGDDFDDIGDINFEEDAELEAQIAKELELS
jgi:hypothetical protein